MTLNELLKKYDYQCFKVIIVFLRIWVHVRYQILSCLLKNYFLRSAHFFYSNLRILICVIFFQILLMIYLICQNLMIRLFMMYFNRLLCDYACFSLFFYGYDYSVFSVDVFFTFFLEFLDEYFLMNSLYLVYIKFVLFLLFILHLLNMVFQSNPVIFMIFPYI